MGKSGKIKDWMSQGVHSRRDNTLIFECNTKGVIYVDEAEKDDGA